MTAAGEGGEGEGGRLREMSGHRRPGRSAGSARTQHSAGEQAEMEQLLAMTARNARPHMAARRTVSPGRKHGQVSNRLARMRLRILYAVCHVVGCAASDAGLCHGRPRTKHPALAASISSMAARSGAQHFVARVHHGAWHAPYNRDSYTVQTWRGSNKRLQTRSRR